MRVNPGACLGESGAGLLVLIFGPAVLGLIALVVTIVCAVFLRTATKPAAKVLLWTGVVLGGLAVFGIGSCYAVVFGRGF